MEGRRALVVGLAGTGLAAAALLQREGWQVSVSERREAGAVDPAVRAQAAAAGWTCHFGGHRPEVFAACDLVVLSPGVPVTLPVLDDCRRRGIPVIGEIELARRHLPGTLVTVTGTKGKSSTVAALAGLLAAAGRAFAVGGHANQPLSACAPGSPLVVAELACYQMEALDAFTSDLHVVTNIFPDHADRYPDFAAYFDLKVRLCRGQRPDQCCVLPQELAAWAEQAGVRSRVLTFSTSEPVERGCWLDAAGDAVHYRDGDDRRRFALDASRLRGHQANLLAAVAAAVRLGVPDEAIARGLAELQPPPHRLQVIHDDGRLRVVDDGACNNAAAVGHALAGLSGLAGPVCLLTLAPEPGATSPGGQVRVIRLQREGLESRLAVAVREQLDMLAGTGGTLLWAPGVPLREADPQAYLGLFAAAVRAALATAPLPH